MNVNLDKSFIKNKTVAVAVSGGSDSMALLHFLLSVKDLYSFSVICINVEHGIRGDSSIKDTEFVINYCKNIGVPYLSYKVNAIKHSKDNKLSIEDSARILRYECFFDAISKKKCDLVATAHHQKDNLESVLFNLFRGTGLKGLCGIHDYENIIIRPFISLSKAEILEYIKQNDIPYVTDQTNYDQNYSRNYIRASIIPTIESKFPSAEKSVYNLSKIVKEEDEFLDSFAKSYIKEQKNGIKILNETPFPLLSRATITALKTLGVKKDWEFAHLKRVCDLSFKQVGKTEDLLLGFIAVKERDGILIYKKSEKRATEREFSVGTFDFLDNKICIEPASLNTDLKSGLYGDLDKISKTAVVRLKKDGDKFKNCNSKTKNLSDFFADRKISRAERERLPVLADGSEILVVFGYAVSDKIKVSDNTKNIIKFTKED